MKIKLKSTPINKYIWSLKILNVFKYPYTELRLREIEVYGHLLYYYNQYSNSSINEDDINALIFSKKNKQEICNNLNITMDNLYNMLVKFRKLGLIKDNKLKQTFSISDKIEILFID